MAKRAHTYPRVFFATALICASTLTACASKPDRKGPQADRQSKGNVKSTRHTGTFVKPVGLLFTGMDANGDAVVSQSELDAGIASEWASFDRKPSLIAFSQWSVKKLGSTDAYPTFMMFDRDLNNVISEDEFSNKLDSEFTSLDKNNDGQVDRSEMLVAFQAQQGRQGGQGSRGQGGGQGGRGQGGGQGNRGGGRP